MLCHPSPKYLAEHPIDPTDPVLESLPEALRPVYARRGIRSREDLDYRLSRLPDPFLMQGMEAACLLLEEALIKKDRILIIGDYDADGATATALAHEGLKALGASAVDYLVPNRFEYGYGLTPEIVELALRLKPSLLITVDNGITSLEGVEVARAMGVKVLITDHHLPGASLPRANAIVNPNLPGDPFPSRALAGVGVMFYVLLALRKHLRNRKYFEVHQLPEPNLAELLDLVALGTVADVVPLDRINRILVHQGLNRIRAGVSRPGIGALLAVANKTPAEIAATDLGYSVGPRLNAAGRLDDMRLGIACLLAPTEALATSMAQSLDQLNRERKTIEDAMRQDALSHLTDLPLPDQDAPVICLFKEDWHPGVVGILASRIKDLVHRPVIAFAVNEMDPRELKGSARTVEGLHIRDLLAEVDAQQPGLIKRFGGHAMAAGLTLKRDQLEAFEFLIKATARRHLGSDHQEPRLTTDGCLPITDVNLERAEAIARGGPWGQGFPEPLFEGTFKVRKARIMAERHLRFTLEGSGPTADIEAVAFHVENPEVWVGIPSIKVAYRLEINAFRGNRTAQLKIVYMEATERT